MHNDCGMPQACFVPLQEALLAVFPLTGTNVTSAFQNKSTSPKRDFSFTKKFQKSKSQKFFDIDKHKTSIVCKTSPTKRHAKNVQGMMMR
jgi:hypothetical protein